MRQLVPAALFAIAVSSPPAVADDNADANRLFVEAVQVWQESGELSGEDFRSLNWRIALVEKALANLKSIVELHPGADLAVRLIIGDAIGPISIPIVASKLADLRAAFPETKAKAEAAMVLCHEVPTRACVFELALEAAYGIDDDLRAYALGDIAVAQANAGLFAKALVSPV